MERFFLLLITLLAFRVSVAQTPDLNFSHITTEMGLSQTFARNVIVDHQGFVWIGTSNGINKFDGYKVTVYKNIPGDSTSLRNNTIYYIFEDSKKNLWICTHNGIEKYERERDCFTHITMPTPHGPRINFFSCYAYEDKYGDLWFGTGEGAFYYDRKKDHFKLYTYDPADSTTISNKVITSICEDKNGTLWLSSSDKLNRFDRTTKTFKHYAHTSDRNSLGNNDIMRIISDKNGNVVIGTRGGGLDILDVDTETFTHYPHDPKDSTSLGSDFILALHKDRLGNLWVGTENGGLNLFHPGTGKFTRYVNDINNQGSILNNTISGMYEDKSGMFWVTTHNGGVSYCNPYQERFRQYQKEIGKSSLSNNIVRAFEGDEEGNLWIATDGGGLNYWNRKSGKYKHYRHEEGNNKGLSSDYVLSLHLDREGYLWIGTYVAGLNRLDRKTNTFTCYKNDLNNPESIGSNTVCDMLEDNQGNLWFATMGGGVAMLDRKTGKFINYRNDPRNDKSIVNDWTICIFKDSKSNIWVGTYDGLNLWNDKTRNFTRFKDNYEKQGTNQINHIFEDSKGNIWVATPGALKLLNQKEKSFTSYTQEDGLPSDVVQNIQEDNRGNLWITTVNGICKFDPLKIHFKNYNVKNEFNQNVQYKTKKGEFIFGGTRGFNIFHPDSIKGNNFIPPVYFTSFEIFNKPVKIGPNSPLKVNINVAKEIVLTHKESVFSFEFAALNYLKPENNEYAYKMEGFDKEWTYAGTRRAVTYTNLEPGEYVLKVKASNNDGVWNNTGTSIKIIILPPWWMTWWFKGLAAVFATVSIIGFYYIRSHAIRERNRFLEEEVKKRTAELKEANDNLEHVNRTKDKFFSIIAHDLKGPVKALVSLMGYLKEETAIMGSDRQKTLTQHADIAAHKVNKLLLDLLEWARAQSRQVKVEPSDIPVVQLFNENRDLLSEQALQKEIDIRIESEEAHLVHADYNMVTTIIRNILSNSIKYTRRGGNIVLSSARTSDGCVRISIADNGIGMSEEILAKLFALEKNGSVKGTDNELGTGLGMIISKEFTTLNKGQIYAESKPGEGSTFYLVLPASKS